MNKYFFGFATFVSCLRQDPEKGFRRQAGLKFCEIIGYGEI